MLKINFDNFVKVPFKDPEWKKKLLGLSVIYLVYCTILYGGIFGGFFITVIAANTSNFLTVFFIVILSFVLFLVSFLIGSYSIDYNLEYVKNVMKGREEDLPVTSNFSHRVFRGVKLSVISAILSLGYLFITSLPFVAWFLFYAINSKSSEWAGIMTVLLIPVYLIDGILSIVALVGIIFITCGFYYLYITESRGIRRAINPKKWLALGKKYWKSYAIMYLMIMALSMIVGVIENIAFCLIIFVVPAACALLQIYAGYLQGELFKMMEKEEEKRINN